MYRNASLVYVSLALLLAIGAFFGPVYGQIAPDKQTPVPEGVSEALTKVRNLKAKSYHHFLREASLIFSPVCVGQPWDAVTTAIDKQMCPVVHFRHKGDTLQRYYLAREKAVSFPNGRSLDAYVWLLRSADRPDKVSQARIVLADAINAKYEHVVKQGRYPRNSVLDVVLRSNDIKREGERWPLVNYVFVHYDSRIGRTGVDYGFDVTVEFTVSVEKAIGKKRMDFFVRSGLGPAYDSLPDGFEPKDTLGEVNGYGGNQWWHGTPDAVKANKEKYLIKSQH